MSYPTKAKNGRIAPKNALKVQHGKQTQRVVQLTLLSLAAWTLVSRAQLLQRWWRWAKTELIVCSGDVLDCCPTCNTTVDNAIQQGVSAQAIVAMDATGGLACNVKAWDHTGLGNALGLSCALQASHAVVDDRGDDGHVERLCCNLGALKDVVVELLASACRAAGRIPRLATGVGCPLSAIWVLLSLLCCFEVLLMCVSQHLHINTHILCKVVAACVVLHDTTASVVLGVPKDLCSCGTVQAETERWLVLPHLASDIITTSKLICKALAILIEDKTSNTTQSLCSQELDLSIGIIGLHEACGVHLHPLKVNGYCADGLAHLDCITGAVLTVCCGQVHQVWTVLGEQRVLAKVSTKATRAKDHWAELLRGVASLAVLTACNCLAVPDELEHLSFGDNAGAVGLLCNFLAHLNQCIGDGHAWEALFATVGPRL